MILASVVLVAAVSVVRADDCAPPKPGDKMTPPWECCKLTDSDFVMPQVIEKAMKKCSEKNPLPKPPSPGDMKGGPSTELKNALSCAAECMFSEAKMLTADKMLDKDAIIRVFTSISKEDKNWGPVIPKVVEKCLASNSDEIDKSLECKSGAKELEQCLMRESFLGCPENAWNDQASCKELKNKVSKCPSIPIMLLKPNMKVN
uniref:Odorant-binding protein 46 n=1 Tax=Matsumurasca onukii TaxID=2912585 RepID=A0A343WGY9_MATON|nr:odorant-binding protein 46 [Matsumurasca onukii]